MIEYKTKIYNGIIAFVSLFLILSSGIVLIALVCRWLEVNVAIALFIYLGLIASFFILKKRIMKLFTKNVKINFTDENIYLLYYDDSWEDIIREKKFPINNIKSYSFDFGSAYPFFTAINIHFKKGFLRSYNFIDKDLGNEKTFDLTLQTDCFVSLFYKCIQQYNANNKNEIPIQLLPSFFGTNKGKIVLYTLTTLIVITIILHIIIDPKSSFYTLMISVGLLGGFYSKRKSSIKLTNRIIQVMSNVF